MGDIREKVIELLVSIPDFSNDKSIKFDRLLDLRIMKAQVLALVYLADTIKEKE